MDYEKARLSPVLDTDKTPSDAAKEEAKRQLKQHRVETQRYKQKYFEYYDDVKINHREDW